MRRSSILVDPDFARYVFRVMSRVKEEVIRELPEQEARIFLTDKTIKQFAENAALEQKVSLLTKLGIGWCIFFSREDADISFLKDVHHQHKSTDHRLEVIKAMEKGDSFCVGSREMMFSLHMCNANTHTSVFMLDPRYQALIKAAKKAHRVSVTDGTVEVMESYNIMSRICTANFVVNDKMDTMFVVSPKKMKILSALFPYRNTFTTRDKLISMIKPPESVKGFSTICGDMVTEGFLLRPIKIGSKDPRYHSYIISEKGLEVVMKYLRWVTEQIEL